jgi:hypothetical protein
MRKLPVIIAAASTLCVFPALAQQPEAGISRDHGSMKGNLGERRTYGSEREGEMRRNEGRYGERAEVLREGCKYVTVRQRRGDEIVIRHFRRCD